MSTTRVEIRDAPDRAEAIRRLASVEPHTTDGAEAEQIAAGCNVLDIIEGGAVVGVCAVRVSGTFATITGIASRGAFPALELQLLEAALKAKGCTHLAFYSKRPGLVRKMLAAGFVIRDCEMEKEL